MWGNNKQITDWMCCNTHSNSEDWMVDRTGLELYYKKQNLKNNILRSVTILNAWSRLCEQAFMPLFKDDSCTFIDFE